MRKKFDDVELLTHTTASASDACADVKRMAFRQFTPKYGYLCVNYAYASVFDALRMRKRQNASGVN